MTDEQMIEEWRTKFYDKYAKHELMEEADFESIAYGFFICLGATPDRAFDLYSKCVKLKIF